MAFDVQGARKAGYTDDEIAGFLAKETKFDLAGAKKAGYSTSEIVGHLTSTKAAPKATLLDKATGFMANVNRGLVVGDELAAGIKALPKAVGALASGDGSGALGAFRDGMADQRGVEDTFQASNPRMAALGRGVGNAATLAAPGGPVTGVLANASRAGNVVRGATAAGLTGAGSAALDRGTLAERGKLASETARNPAVLAAGALGGALAPAARRPTATRAVTPANTLRDAGVQLTPGQRMGGLAKSTEDLAQRAPILGPAIRGARQRGGESLVRAVGNRSLAPLGETVPAEIATGRDLVGYVADRLGREYDEAAAMVPQVTLDAPFQERLTQITREAGELGPQAAQQLQTIIDNRIAPLLARPNISGAEVREVQSQIQRLGAIADASDDGAQRAVGGMLDGLGDELGGLIGRANPEAAERIARAGEGWSNYVRLRRASANSKNGIPTPGQLTTAVRTSDRSVGKGRVARGDAVLQDLTDAASEVMPDAFGNPGTADAVGLGALGTLAITNPVKGLATAGVLGAAATPYMLMARRVADQVPRDATQRQLQEAARTLRDLAQRDPNVANLYREVSARLSRVAGVSGGTSAAR